MSEPEEDYDDLLDEAEHHWRNRVIGLVVLAALVAAGVYALWVMVLSGDGASEEETQTAEVERGSISLTVSTTGVAVAQSATDLSFDQSGRVSAVNVELGQDVKEGDVLAEIESAELEDAVTTAEVNLTSAQVKLSQLLEGTDLSDLLSADQSVVQAQASLDQANRALEELFEGPSDSEQLSAEDSVSSAQASLDQANRSLSDLTDGPTASEELSAEQAVASAEATLDQANRAHDDLTADPNESERLSAEQAVTSAETQLDQAEAARAELYSANADAVAAAQEAVNRAQDALDSAAASLASARAELFAEEKAYCDQVPGPSDIVSFCPYATGAAPISPTDEQTLLNRKALGTPAAEAAHAASVLAANTSYVKALEAEQSAAADLAAAQSDLSEAQQGPSSEDLARADADITAAQQALELAEAKLAELYEGPTESELEDAQDRVDEAERALELAEAKLAELYEGPTQSELEDARDKVEEAEGSLELAKAKLAELNEPPTENEIKAAQENIETAEVALVVAQAKRDDVYAGSDWEDIELQQGQVKLAELSVERAREDLEEVKLVAPFDGTVEEINVQVGDDTGGTAASAEAAIVLNTPDAVYLDVTITEADRSSIEAGQSGVASFDAIEDRMFPIVIESVGTNPTTTQGIVTYEVRASIQTELPAGIAGALPSGAPGASASPQAAAPTPKATASAGTPAAGATPSAGTPAAGATPSAATPTPKATASANTPAAAATPSAGTPAAGATPSAPGRGVFGGTLEVPFAADTETKPLPGMNASITITVDQAQDVLTVPAQAVQTEGRNSIVEVQKEDGTTERLVVETGLSDGTTTEIVQGLEEGQTVIVPSGTAVAVQPTAAAGFPQFPVGGFEQRGSPGEGGGIIGGGAP